MSSQRGTLCERKSSHTIRIREMGQVILGDKVLVWDMHGRSYWEDMPATVYIPIVKTVNIVVPWLEGGRTLRRNRHQIKLRPGPMQFPEEDGLEEPEVQ